MARKLAELGMRLAEKLLLVRTLFGLSQNQLVVRLGMVDELARQDISDFERGVREPPLTVLLQYARTAGISVEQLIDDKLQLPRKLPIARQKHNSGNA